MSKRWILGGAAGTIIGGAVLAAYLTGMIGCIPQTRISVRQQYTGTAMAKPAEDWPRWRGSRTDGISRETVKLESWPESGPPALWSADVGLGHSSPIALDGRVYLFSMNERKETLTCFDANSGRIVWSVESDEGWTSSYVGTRATPAIDGDRIYTYGGRGQLICRKIADGSVVWQMNVLSETGSGNLGWGTASSPMVEGSRVYVQSGKGGAIAIAVDKMSGNVAWKSQATGIGGYAAPILAEVGGTRQLILFGGETIYGANPDTGATLWQYPWQTSYDVNASTPVYDPASSRLFVTSGYGHGGIQLQLTPAGATKVWENKHIEGKYQGAILDGGYLYANSEGALVCVRWDDGSLVWNKRDVKFRLGAGGSIVRAGDKLITLSERGKLSLVRATPQGATMITQAKALDGTEIWATPLLYGGRLYVKGMQELVCYDVGGK